MLLNNKYYLSDEESGQFYEVSKEKHEAAKRLCEETSRCITRGKAPIIITGTAQSLTDTSKNPFYELWKK